MSETLHKASYATGYRAILLDALEQRCQRNPRYSQRAFARDLGIAPHRISEILRGRQGMSRARAEQLAKRLDLDSGTTRSFCDMVAAAHSRSSVDRQAAATRLARQEPRTKANASLDVDRFKTISDWHHLAIIETLKLADAEPTVLGLAARLGIAGGQVRVAVDRMLKLGLIGASPDGRLAPIIDATIGGDVPSAAVRTYHEQHLDKAKDALLLQPFEARDFNTLVMAIDRKRLPQLKERLAAFVEAVNAEFSLDADAGADAVYAFTAHTFRMDQDPPHSGTTKRETLS